MSNKEGKASVPPIPKKKVPEKKSYKKTEIKSISKGLIPPSAIDLEEAVLGVLLSDRNAISEIAEILEPEYFYIEHHKEIYKAIKYMYSKDMKIDLLTVSEELKRKHKLDLIGGDFYLISLTQRVSSSAHIEFHARIVVQKYIKRALIKQANYTIEESYKIDSDIFDILDKNEHFSSDLRANVIKVNGTNNLSAMDELKRKIKNKREGKSTGFYFTIDEFDEWSGGIQDREMVTIAARPGMGKTSLVLIIASSNAFKYKKPTAIFSLEMSKNDLMNRLASGETGVEFSRIRTGDITDEEADEIEAYFKFLESSCLHIIEKMTALETICNKIRELVKNEGVRAVLIDYVQLMTMLGSRYSSDRTGELNTITRTLKSLANELDIPIIILAQLSRAVDNRPGKRPNLTDLKQSGSIEEDSDIVIFLLRMAAYDQIEGKLVPPNLIGRTEFIVAKGRSTGLRNFWINFNFKNFEFESTV